MNQIFSILHFNVCLKKTGVLICALVASLGVSAQYSFKARIITGGEKQVLAGTTVTIKGLNRTSVADSTGYVTIGNIPSGLQTIIFTHVGYQKKELRFNFLYDTLVVVEMFADEEQEDEEEIIVTATRSSRTIRNLPTRVETISGEELEEKSNMKPGDIRMMLSESTGIQTQQTSATSYNSGIRIQGLDGRYTQLIRDGYPLYAGFSGGLSIMQIAPLDLKQVEVIKGASSTLYGGGAIAGLINLVSKTPGENRELNFLANATSAGGLDLSGFYAQKFKKTGVTFFGSGNTGRPYDPAGTGFTAIPKFSRYTFNPRLFLYLNNRTVADLGVSLIRENRIGGDINFINKGTPGYFEKNATDRFTLQLGFNHRFTEKSRLTVKNSLSRFNRGIQIPGYVFEGLQMSTFSEAAYYYRQEKSEWISGVSFITDHFREVKQAGVLRRNYMQQTAGAFLQNTWTANTRLTIETGLRGDYVNDYGFFLLPRLSALFTLNSKLGFRVSGGLGYKAPNIFTEDAERVQFQNILPVNIPGSRVERSAGSNFDINYRTSFADGALAFSVNHLFFYTRLNSPLILTAASNNLLQFTNANGYVDTKGMETNLKFIYGDFKLFIGYTYADVHQHFNDVKSWFPLTARHRLNNVLMYEAAQWKLGLEAYYVSPQKLTDGTMGRSYWINGFMAERLWKNFSVFINFENFLDTRQTRFGSIYTGSITNPQFKDIYAPVDGFVINGGVKLNL